MPDAVVSDIFFYSGCRLVGKTAGIRCAPRTSYSEFVVYKQHFDSRGVENIWTRVCDMPVAGRMFFSPLSCNGLFAALVSLNVLVLVSMETKRGVENREALLWSPALSCVLPAAAATYL